MKSQLAERRRDNALFLANAHVDARGFEIDAGRTFGYKGTVRGLSPRVPRISTVQLFAPMRHPESRAPPCQNLVLIDPLGQHLRQPHTRFP
jgi:hypothetical protein